jgi:hypothetical protein
VQSKIQIEFREALPMELPDPFLPGAISLLEQLDKKLVIVLRDGKTLIGYLRTLDQVKSLKTYTYILVRLRCGNYGFRFISSHFRHRLVKQIAKFVQHAHTFSYLLLVRELGLA